jgi:hypothetical protein
MQCLPFLQTLLTMEAMAEYTDAARARVAAGDTEHQNVLIEAEKIEELLSTGTLVIEPAPVPAHLTEAVRRFSSRIRARIEAGGETVLKETLAEVEVVQRHLDAGKLRIEPARIPAAA